jgi:hypothetical protein
MTTAALHTDAVPPIRQPRFRYGAVFLIVLTLVVIGILGPDAAWARAVLVVLAGGALSVSVATSSAPGRIRGLRALVVGVVALALVVGIATGLISATVTFAVVTVVIALIPVTLVGGLLALVREEGVTFQAVAGALAIYLLVGLLFASLIAFVAHVQSGSYFVQGHVSNGERVYYSFTVLTTTGFGDYSAAKPVGHAIAVLEMLTGQLYLVTVIGVLIGHYVRSSK